MRVASKIVSIVFGVSAIISSLLGTLMLGVAWLDVFVELIAVNLPLVASGFQGVAVIDIVVYVFQVLVSLGLNGLFLGLAQLFLVILLVAGIVSLIASRNKTRKKGHMAQIILGTVAGSFGIIVGGVLGYVADTMEERKLQREQVEE